MNKVELRKDLVRSVNDYLDFIKSEEDYYEDGLSEYENEIFEKALKYVTGNENIFDEVVNPALEKQDE